jgi:hypothetical protein
VPAPEPDPPSPTAISAQAFRQRPSLW